MNDFQKLFKRMSLSESYISMAVGLLVVIVIAILAFNYFNRGQGEISLPGIQAPQIKEKVEEKVSLPKKHTVEPNENLWTIAMKYYGSGYNWVTLQNANKLTNADTIWVGQVLDIPEAAAIKPTLVTSTNTAAMPQTYTIVRGDSLWKVAVKVYGNGYAWAKLAQTNRIPNPNLIYAGNVLKIPR